MFEVPQGMSLTGSTVRWKVILNKIHVFWGINSHILPLPPGQVSKNSVDNFFRENLFTFLTTSQEVDT